MTLSESKLAYQDCFDAYDRGLEAERGIRIHFSNFKDAKYFSMRMNQARSLDRKANARTYPKDHPLYGASNYDSLVLRVKEDVEGDWWVYIEPNTAIPGEVEVL